MKEIKGLTDAIDEVNKLVQTAGNTRNFFKRAEAKASALNVAIDNIEVMISDLQQESYIDKNFDEAMDSTLEVAPGIVTEEINSAAKKNQEYNYTAFLTPLLDIAQNEDLYQIIPNGAGWNRNIKVTLKMNEVAGSIGDYASAVERTRKELKVREGRDPTKASKFWREKVWPSRAGRGMYGKTIGLRQAEKSTEAPYWSLLNDGNRSVKMDSDIGGTPYPSHGGTHFVEYAQRRIARFFRLNFRARRTVVETSIAELRTEMDKGIRALNTLNSLVDSIVFGEEDLTVVESRLKQRVLDDIDPSRLFKARDKILSQGIITGRFDVGRAGGPRVQLSVSTILSTAGEY